MKKDEDLDNIFKKGLQDPADHSSFMNDDWDAMENMLDKRKKRPAIIYWLPVLGGVAALLLVAIGWWLLKPEVRHQPKTQQAAVGQKNIPQNIEKRSAKDSGKRGGSIQQMAAVQPKNVSPAVLANNFKATIHNPKSKLFFESSADGSRRDTTGKDNSAVYPAATNTNVAAIAVKPVIGSPANAMPASVIAAVNPRQNDTADASSKKIYKPVLAKNKVKASTAYRPQFALNVLASSDLNGVNSLQQSKVGNNVGVLFSAGLFKKFTISTGAIYSSKPYITSFANYHTSHQFAADPLSVQADCRMLDIPINIDYQVYHKNQNKISIGTGLSSYLMLHESYKYNYADYTTGPASYNVANPGKYFLSVVNLQATYDRQINSKFGISVQPYMKLPISAVGVSQVKLQSTGVAVGLTWNLNNLAR